MNIISVLTETTCGDACWRAREEVCRCSCGGKNHGVLRSGEQPVRTAKNHGVMYQLVAVGKHRDLYDQANRLVNACGFAAITPYGPNTLAHYTWRETDAYAPARLKYASAAQIEKWPELSAYRELDRWERAQTSLLWQRTEQQAPRYCKTACEKCAAHQAKFQ